jgi:hypothetical protein
MKKIALFTVLALALSSAAFADSLSVTGGAAMDGSFGLNVAHDNSSVAYVQDDTPTAETIYRGSFQYNPNNISPGNGNWRQTIFAGFGPKPATPGCAAFGATVTSFRIFLFMTNGGTTYNVQAYVRGMQCGETNTARIPISASAGSLICFEYKTGAALTGAIRLAVAGEDGTCPASASPDWEAVSSTNTSLSVDFVRMGTPQTNAFGRGENGNMFYDKFQSFRTLVP